MSLKSIDVLVLIGLQSMSKSGSAHADAIPHELSRGRGSTAEEDATERAIQVLRTDADLFACLPS